MLTEINVSRIEEAVARLCIEANRTLPTDIIEKINTAARLEKNELGNAVMCELCRNISAAKEMVLPICQDTGMAVVFIEVGQDVHLVGGDLETAINRGVAKGYCDGLLRKSIVADPLRRGNTNDNTPAVIHTKIVAGNKVKITVAPKGFGSENMSAIKMLTPSASAEGVVDFVIDTVKRAGGNPCPPIVVGVGIGGDFESSAYLAKKALCRSTDEPNADKYYADMEKLLLNKINELNIGPQGFGGNTTALAVNIEVAPTHIAGLPVAVNIGCHVTRHKTEVLG